MNFYLTRNNPTNATYPGFRLGPLSSEFYALPTSDTGAFHSLRKMILAAIVHGALSLDDVYQLKGRAQAEEFSSIIARCRHG